MSIIDELIAYKKREPILFYAYASIPVIAILYFIIGLPIGQLVHRAQLNAATANLKQNMHSYQLSLERYAVDTDAGTYPIVFEDLLDEGYLNDYLPNPYYGLVDEAPPKMTPVRAGEFVPGCFVYGTSDRMSSYQLVGLGWWVVERPADNDALIYFAPPMSELALMQMTEYLFSGQTLNDYLKTQEQG